jgi:adenosylhomocysteine nucleosidase
MTSRSGDYNLSMTDILFDDPCVVFALRREAGPFLQEFRPQQRVPGGPCRAWFCGPEWLSVLVLETGVGTDRAEQAMQWLFGPAKLGDVPCRPKVVLSAGFAGGLAESLRVGDVVLATEVVEPDGTTWPATWPGELPPGEWRPLLHRARVLTTRQMIGDPAEKRRLAEQHQTAAVDMESAVIARWCRRQDVPFGCLRAISDDRHTALSPRLVDLLSGGRVAWPRLLAALAGSPRLAGELWRLARQTRLAARQLGTALGEVLTLTLPWTV